MSTAGQKFMTELSTRSINAAAPSSSDTASSLAEKLIRAAVDYEIGRCSRRELSEARAAVETAIASPPGLVVAVKNFFALWDRCGGSEAISAKAFADARQDMRDAINSETRCPHCGEVGDHDGYCGVC